MRRPRVENALVTAVGRSHGVLLVGDNGSGKSTMLNWLGRRLEGEGHSVARVDAAIAADPLDLVALIAVGIEDVTGAVAPADVSASPSLTVRLQRAVQSLRTGTDVTLLIDNLVDHEIIKTMFGRLRDVTWATGHRWVVAARRTDLPVFTAPPSDAFFAERILLPELEDRELERFAAHASEPIDLSTLSTRLPRDAVRRVLRPDEPTPLPDEGTTSEAESRVLREVLAADRPVGADDEELQARLGMSSFTLKRHLRELAGQRVLIEEPERSGRPGRPRLLYSSPALRAGDAG